MKQNQIIAALLAAFAGWYFFMRKKEDQQPALDFPTGGIKPPPVLTNQVPTNQGTGVYPIKYMVYHPDVKQLQKVLGVTQDGIIGPITLSKLKQKIDPNLTASQLSIGSYGDLLRIIDIVRKQQ